MLEGLLALTLLAAQTKATVSQAESFQIVIRVNHVRNAVIRQACKEQSDRLHACAHIIGDGLSTSCSEDRGAWSLAVRAHATALVYVVNPDAGLDMVNHELRHIWDIQEAGSDVMVKATAVAYRTNEQCEAAAAALAARFHGELQEAARSSEAKRD